MKKKLSLLITTLIIPLCCTVLHGQRGRGLPGQGLKGVGGAGGRIYDVQSVETITGKVLSIDKFVISKRNSYCGIHLIVVTKSETITVHLGPVWYHEEQNCEINPDDNLEITGSRITYEGKPVIVAALVKRGDDKLELRNSSGTPYWSGWRRGWYRRIQN